MYKILKYQICGPPSNIFWTTTTQKYDHWGENTAQVTAVLINWNQNLFPNCIAPLAMQTYPKGFPVGFLGFSTPSLALSPDSQSILHTTTGFVIENRSSYHSTTPSLPISMHESFIALNHVGSFSGGPDGKEPACRCRKHVGSVPELGRAPGGENGNILNILAWKIPWTEEPSGLQSMGSQRVRHSWATNTHTQNGQLCRTLWQIVLHSEFPSSGSLLLFELYCLIIQNYLSIAYFVALYVFCNCFWKCVEYEFSK